MHCSLARLSTSRSIRPVATTYYRFFSLKLADKCKPEVRDLFNKANCPRLSATTNLARLLNLMDNRIGVTPAVCPRWDVIENAKALYITRDLSGLHRKDTLYTDRRGVNEWCFGCTVVRPGFHEMCFTVSLGIPGPGYYPEYYIRISTPETIYCPSEDTVMDVKGDVLKITIPKKKVKWSGNRITTNARLHW